LKEVSSSFGAIRCAQDAALGPRTPGESVPSVPPVEARVWVRQPARFPSEETRFDSSFALLSLRSRNRARSVFDGLPRPTPSPLPSRGASGRPPAHIMKTAYLEVIWWCDAPPPGVYGV